MSIPQQFFRKVRFSASTGCWLWTGSIHRDGHGWYGSSPAHRIAYEAFVGPLGGLKFRHAKSCPKHCVNPFHCRPPGTQADNVRDMLEDGTNWQAQVTHCPRGHEYSQQNTRLYRGYRHCRACDRARPQRPKRA